MKNALDRFHPDSPYYEGDDYEPSFTRDSDPNELEDLCFDGINNNDYPDYVDAYISGATFWGRELNDQELDILNDCHYQWTYEKILQYILQI